MENPVPVSDSIPRCITCHLCIEITYADGYPTTESDTIRAIVERPEGIAEDSSISCGLSDCTKCRVFHYTQCKQLVKLYDYLSTT